MESQRKVQMIYKLYNLLQFHSFTCLLNTQYVLGTILVLGSAVVNKIDNVLTLKELTCLKTE